MRQFWNVVRESHHLQGLMLFLAVTCSSMVVTSCSFAADVSKSQVLDATTVTYRVTQQTQRLDMIVNSSRMITLDLPVPKLQVHNPKLLRANPVGPNQIQVAALAPGVTQLNLWDKEDRLYTVDIVITGDSRELEAILASSFPSAALRITVLPSGAIIDGTVTDPSDVEPIIQVCEQFFTNIVNNIRVSGVQTVNLHTKVLEVSRTKLRQLGIDLGYMNGNFLALSAATGQFSPTTSNLADGILTAGSNGTTARIGGVFSSNTIDTLFKALRENDLLKVVAEPTVVAVHGRPARFTAGGKFPVVIPAGNNQVTVQFVEFGTSLDFVPFVLNENRLRLELRPEISELDPTRGVTLNGTTIPGIRQRYVDTAVEMDAGQTWAVAGLIQQRTEAANSGLPFFSDLPYVGALFRRVSERVNDIEVLFVVTPEFSGALDPHQVPAGGPGLDTTSPSNCELYGKGYIEVPFASHSGSCEGMGREAPAYSQTMMNHHVDAPAMSMGSPH